MKKRLFIAISINASESLKQQQQNLQQQLACENITWIKLENLHLTIKFLGETDEKSVPQIIETIHNCEHLPPPYSLIINRIGIFGTQYKPRVIWAGTADLGETMLLREMVLKKIETIGYERDRQNFIPHISLARMEKLYDLKRFQSIMQQMGVIKPETIEVKNFHLYESILKPEGPEYKVLHTFLL